MGDGIFLIRDGKLMELVDRPYDSEDLLQTLLAEYPGLIAGKQIDSASPRRWLLISREMMVPAEEGGASRWSLDHLFLDQDGIPTLVEVKRSTDSRIRREVVGQMLDYAANAVVYWPVEEVRGRFESRCEAANLDAIAELGDFLLGEDDADTFWSKVKTNLQAGKIRLIFVADVIPAELRRIVEFLNEQMDPAEVLALEIKQYVGESLQTLVPRVIGQTAEAEKKKSSGRSASHRWNEVSFFTEIQKRNGDAVARVAREIFDWAKPKENLWLGRGSSNGWFGLIVRVDEIKYYLFAISTRGTIEIYFQWLKNNQFFSEDKRREFLTYLNAIPGVNIPDSAITGRPSMKLSVLVQPDRLQKLIAALSWAVAEIHDHEHGTKQHAGTVA